MSNILTISMPVLNNTVRIILREGESLGIVGENMSGKSEVLQRIRYHKFGLTYRGVAPADFTKEEEDLFLQEIGYSAADMYLNPKDKVIDVLGRCAVAIEGIPDDVAKVFCIMPTEYDLKVKDVDYILLSKLILIDTLSHNYRVIMIDDVFGYDYTFKRRLIPFLEKYRKDRGVTYLIATTDIVFASQLTEWTMVVYADRLVEYAQTKHLITSPNHPYSKWLINSTYMEEAREIPTFIRTASDPIPPKDKCPFSAICPYAIDKCKTDSPVFASYNNTDWTACHLVNTTEPPVKRSRRAISKKNKQ